MNREDILKRDGSEKKWKERNGKKRKFELTQERMKEVEKKRTERKNMK